MAYLLTSEISKVLEDSVKGFSRAQLALSQVVYGEEKIRVSVKDWSYYNYLRSTTGETPYSVDCCFEIKFPMDYFSDNQLDLVDQKAGVQPSDSIDTQAKKRCLELINYRYNEWFNEHPYEIFVEPIKYSEEDFLKWVEIVINSLNKNLGWQLILNAHRMRGSDIAIALTDSRVWDPSTRYKKELMIYASWLQENNKSTNLWDDIMKEQGKDVSKLTLDKKIALRLATFIYREMKTWLYAFGY